MPINNRPLTPPEMLNAERLLTGLDSIEALVYRWNDIARPLGVPPIEVRYAGAPSRLFGSVAAYNDVQDMIHDSLTRQIVAFEKAAA